MRILVTGAGGFVGRRLVARLVRLGHEVFGVVRRLPAPEDASYFAGAKLLERDITHLEKASLPPGVEALITLAQSSRFREFPEQAEEVFAVNVISNLQLLQWAVGTGVRRVVHASSGGIYGGKQGGQFLETDLPAVDSPLGFYLGSKLCGEVVLQNYRQFFESTVILRPFFIYGSSQRKDMFVSRLIESVRNGTPISLQGADGLRTNPIHVDDAADAFCAALALDGMHVINIAGPDVLPLRRMGELIGDHFGKRPVFETRPGDPVDYVADIEAMRKLLGITPRSLATGLADALSEV